jgi:hypothetical protein
MKHSTKDGHQQFFCLHYEELFTLSIMQTIDDAVSTSEVIQCRMRWANYRG